MILDIGCGDNPQGDINVDLYLNTHHVKQTGELTHTKAELICDGNYLPFRSNSFDKVISYHVIEHSITPFQFLKECVRVSKGKIEIKCPHRFSKGAKAPFHKDYFNKKWFIKACQTLNVTPIISVKWNQLNKSFITLPLQIPDEITVNIQK